MSLGSLPGPRVVLSLATLAALLTMMLLDTVSAELCRRWVVSVCVRYFGTWVLLDILVLDE